MDDPILELLKTTDLSSSEAVDFVAVEKLGMSQSEWARERDVSPQAVSKNVANARSKLGE